jgi:hypothetical protein
VLEDLRKDMVRYRTLGGWYRHPGFWIGAIYRFGVWAHQRAPGVRRHAAAAAHHLAR